MYVHAWHRRELSCSANAAFTLGSREAPSDVVPAEKKWKKRPFVTRGGGKKGWRELLLPASSSHSAKQPRKIFQPEDHKEAAGSFSPLPLHAASKMLTPKGSWVGNVSQTEAGGSRLPGKAALVKYHGLH